MKNNYIFLLCFFFLLSASLHGQFINCNNSVYLSLDSNGEGILTPNMFLEGINPDDLDSIWLDIDYVNCDNIGSPIIITVYGELDGTLDSCTTELTVEDKSPPIAIVEANGIPIDVSNGPVNLDPMLIDDGSWDNCDLTYEVEPSVIDCNSASPTLVTLTVTDPSGNSTSAVTEVVPVGDFENIGLAMACNLLNSINVINGPVELLLEDVLEAGPSVCLSNYIMDIENTDSIGPTPSDNIFTEDHVGYTFNITIYDSFTFQTCWSSVTIIDGSESYNFCAQDFNGNNLSDVVINSYSTEVSGCTDVFIDAGSIVKPTKTSAPLKGVDLIDVLIMKGFIFELIDLNVYQKFASDIDGDGEVTDDDIIFLFEVFLGQSNLDQTWYFHDSTVPLEENTTQSTIDETITISENIASYNFTGIKLGDLDLSYESEFSSNENTALSVKDIVLNKGESHVLDLFVEGGNLYAFDINLAEETEDYKIINVTSAIPGFEFNAENNVTDGFINLNWLANDEEIKNSGYNFQEGQALVSFEIYAKENSILSESFSLNEGVGSRIVIDGILNSTKNLELEINDKITVPTVSIEEDVFTLSPNPTSDIVIVDNIGDLANVEYLIYDVSGAIIQKGKLSSGAVDVSEIENGLYYFFLSNGNSSHSQKLMILR